MKLDTSEPFAASSRAGDSFKHIDLTGPVHFIGIGGIGMSAIARLLLARGVAVSGSDKEASAVTALLAQLGAKIFVGHSAENVAGVKTLVVSTAITAGNPELAAALARGTPVWHRSDLLAYLSSSSKLLAVSGTHGKTTTAGMLAHILLQAELDPTVVLGGILPKIASNAHPGKGPYFVAEADESDGTHVKAKNYVSIVTNIEPDHLENYPGGFDEICEHMLAFANHTDAFSLLCADDAGCRRIMPKISVPMLTYGAGASFDYGYVPGPNYTMTILKKGKTLGEINLSVPGEHNKLNALAAAAVALELGSGFESIKSALRDFTGVERRFQILGEAHGIMVVDDYAHHPTEVRAVLQAARSYAQSTGRKSRIVSVFQPHQPGRLKSLWDEFCMAFNDADLVLITDIYIARGGAIEGIDSRKFARCVKHPNVAYVGGKGGTLASKIKEHLRPGDLVLTIGAGDITGIGRELLNG